MNEYLNNTNILAFLHVIRTGEGTIGDKGYRTYFGGGLFDSFADHPRKINKAGGYSSSAAGAYQFLTKTWDGLVRQYHFADFSPYNQDLGAVYLIKGRGALQDVLDGNIESAIKKCSLEWASLPGSPYGQPTISLTKALDEYRIAGGVLRPTSELAPLENKDVKMLPLVAAVLPSLVNAVPELIRIFGAGGVQAEKNAKAAELVVNAAKAATGSVNEQQLIEKLESNDPLVREQVQNAVKELWYDIALNTTGIQEAREANAKSEGFYKQPTFWVTLLLLPLAYIVVLSVLGLIGSVVFSTEIQIMVVSSIVSGLLSGIVGYWLGTSWSSSRKTELANR